MPMIIGLEGPTKGQRFQVEGVMSIGRAVDATIRLDDLSVSRHHAQLKSGKEGAILEDLGSGNGSFVNDERIAGPTLLKTGDTVRFSEIFIFRFYGDESQLGSKVDLVDQPSKEQPAVMETLDVKKTMMALPGIAQAKPEELLRAHERFRLVLEIGNAVQTVLDMDKLLSEIMDRLFQVFPQADRGFIMLKEDDGEELVTRVARQRGQAGPATIATSRSVIDKAMKGRIAVLSADAMADTRFSTARSVMNLQIRSMMCVPVIANEAVLGIIHLDTQRQDKRFSLDDLELLTGVANQTAFAIANARSHQRLLRQQRMERDLQLARQVQRSFLPNKPAEIPGMLFCATYRAALEVGGDFYDFIQTGKGKLGIIVGDVAGKGIPAALMMARTTSDARSLAMNDTPPPTVVRFLNDHLNATGTEGSFITLIYLLLDTTDHSISMVNAAHPPPVLRGADGKVTEIQSCTNFPVGAVEENEFEGEQFALKPGEVLVLITDGVTEAMNARKELFGTARVLASVARPATSPQQVMENVLQDVQAFVGDTYQSDDLTLVCFGVTG